MQDSKTRRPDEAAPDSDATSTETLEDLEKSEKGSDSESQDAPDESQVPSPDGTGDAPRDKPDDAGPM